MTKAILIILAGLLFYALSLMAIKAADDAAFNRCIDSGNSYFECRQIFRE